MEAEQKPPLLPPQLLPARPFLLGAARPSGPRHETNIWGASPRGHLARTARKRPEPILPEADCGPPAAPYHRKQQHAAAAVRAHSPTATVGAAGSDEDQLRSDSRFSRLNASGQPQSSATELAEAFRAERAASGLAAGSANPTLPRRGGTKCSAAARAPRATQASARPALGCGRDAAWSASGW